MTITLFLCCNKSNSQETTDWVVSSLVNKDFVLETINASPKVVRAPFGEVLKFNGVDEALFLEEMPLTNLKSFTVEMIFKPEIDGDFEQRVLHMGEVSSDRMLLEIRVLNGDWYFDGFVKSGENKKALVDETMLHKLGNWYHVAFIVEKDGLTTYVNGKQELYESFKFKPIQTGKTSIGVRLNKKSFFKGDIYRIRVTPKPLKPKDFLSFK
ncbi:LamG domain-containing protein [Aestuariibaculum sp. M13]|uniref:LamG domain-containing protein n=1 Tax=Aestuariibaculum sp. M13 TaxID=2967132 RepID=UPI002159D120|nr:LamG domain-containing protein [Aestuariibaculum sp. M13]MCR8666779.1 LamG domain-containing protein [Aestuariibaculum sp. M13]